MQKESINEATATAHMAIFGNTPVFSLAFFVFAIEKTLFLKGETRGNWEHNYSFVCLGVGEGVCDFTEGRGV